MNDKETQAETQRLLALSDSLVTANRHEDKGLGSLLIAHALNGCFALVFAAIPAWLASQFLDNQSAIFVFCSMIIFYGCIDISTAIAGQSVAHMKVLDNINALRIAVIDLANRVSCLSDKD